MFSIELKIIICFIFATRSCSERPVVQIDSEDFQGSMVGVKKINILNETFEAFLGIPYAKPPVGTLRFRDPQKLHKFEGTFHAINEGHECCSITASNASEDCLILNVYTKKISPTQSLPTVVVIHPGGLYLGSSQWMDPSYMMTKDIVLVTFNYRLGSLGFLNMGTEKIPGNAGFKDQVYALRWVKQNIGNFGGNPQDVTLMGYSAGALSVSLHLVSPMARGLFQKAIIMSGALPPQTKIPHGHQRYLAVRQAQRLNCQGFKELEGSDSDYKDIDDMDLLACLRRFSGMELAKTLRQMFDFGKDNPIYLWLPVVEKDYGQERFLEDDFYTALRKGRTLKIPLLMGYATGEFCTSAGDILKDEKLTAKFEKEFDSLAPRLFGYESRDNKKDITAKLLNLYFNGSLNFNPHDYDSLCDVFSDALIRFGAHRTAEIVGGDKGLVYFYEFDYQGQPKEPDTMFPERRERVEHMDDLQYLFNWSKKSHLSQDDMKMVDLYTNFMYDFIKNGKLTSAKAKPYSKSYALIGDDIQFVEGRNFENMRFWSNLFRDED